MTEFRSSLLFLLPIAISQTTHVVPSSPFQGMKIEVWRSRAVVFGSILVGIKCEELRECPRNGT